MIHQNKKGSKVFCYLFTYATHWSVEISLSHISVAPFVDVTALEIEVKGESTPLNVVLHPYATH